MTVCCSMFVYVIYSVLFKKRLTFKKYCNLQSTVCSTQPQQTLSGLDLQSKLLLSFCKPLHAAVIAIIKTAPANVFSGSNVFVHACKDT